MYQSWFTCQFELLLEVCWISASEAQFPGLFGPQNRTWFRSLKSFSQIFFTSCFACLLGVCLGVFQGVFSLAAELVRPPGLLYYDNLQWCLWWQGWHHGNSWIIHKGVLSHATGPRFNIKMSYRYRKYHCWDKTVVRSSYLHSGISYSGKMTSLYWIRVLDPFRVLCYGLTTCLLHGISSLKIFW